MKSSRGPSSSKPAARRGTMRQKSATRSVGKNASTAGSGKRKKSAAKTSGNTETATRKRTKRSLKQLTNGKSKGQARSSSRRLAGSANREGSSYAKGRTRSKKAHVPISRAVQTPPPPQAEPAERPATPEVPPHQTAGTIPDSPVQKPVDPLEMEAKLRLQRQAARSPLMPHGPTASRPMPPRSGKPIWRRPHSS